jgi:hypothetical protein
MLRYLREASPWARFLGIAGFIYCGFTALVGIGFLVLFPLLMSSTAEAVADIGESGNADFSMIMRAMGGAYGFVFIIGAVLSFFPALFTYNYGTKIRNYQRSGADQDLEAAFRNNKSLLKFTGILTIIALAMIPLFIIISIVVAIFAAFA